MKTHDHVRIFWTPRSNNSKSFCLQVKNEVVLSHHWTPNNHFPVRPKRIGCQAINLWLFSVEILTWIPSNCPMLSMNEVKDWEGSKMVFKRQFLASFCSVKLPAVFFCSSTVAFVLSRLAIFHNKIIKRVFLLSAHIRKCRPRIHKPGRRRIGHVQTPNLDFLKRDLVMWHRLVQGEPLDSLLSVRLDWFIVPSDGKLAPVRAETESEFSFVDKFGGVKHIEYRLESSATWGWKS